MSRREGAAGLAAINEALLCDILPGVWALRAVAAGVWRSTQEADAARHAVLWISERLASEIEGLAEAVDDEAAAFAGDGGKGAPS